MKKIAILLTLFTLTSVASAQEFKDGLSVFGGVVSGKTAGEKGTGYTVGVDYTKYLDKGFFIQPSLQYLDTNSESNDKHTIALLNAGYSFKLDNGMTLSPKAGVGYRHTKYNNTYMLGEMGEYIWTVHEKGSDDGVAYNVGLDLAVSKNVNLGLGYMRMKGDSGNHANYTTLSLGYKF